MNVFEKLTVFIVIGICKIVLVMPLLSNEAYGAMQFKWVVQCRNIALPVSVVQCSVQFSCPFLLVCLVIKEKNFGLITWDNVFVENVQCFLLMEGNASAKIDQWNPNFSIGEPIFVLLQFPLPFGLYDSYQRLILFSPTLC